MAEARRKRGRPKGSKNKRFSLSATVAQFCEQNQYDPLEKLHAIATFTDYDDNGQVIPWDMDRVFKAREWLADAVYNKKIHASLEVTDGTGGGQIQFGFIEGDSGFSLPGESQPESAAGTVGERALPSAGDSSQIRQDGIGDQSPGADDSGL